jgi:uncharacterized protein
MGRMAITNVVGAIALTLTMGTAYAGSIHDAARLGDTTAIQNLLNAGTDINELDESGETALFAAALASRNSSHNKILDFLLQRQADYTIRNDRGMTVLHASAFVGDAESVAHHIGTDGPYHKPLDINDHANKFGVTPLIVAAEENHGNVVAYLIMWGADLEITERHGYTALTRASYHGHDQIIDILLRAGAVCQEIDPAWKAECEKRKSALGL